LKIHILGKSNSTISVQLDALYESYNCTFTVNIIQNISVDETPPYRLEKVDRFNCNIINDNDWDGNFEKLLLGVIRVSTKIAVCDSFFKSHKIRENDYFTLFHPSSIISKQNEIGSGVFIGPGSIIAPYVTLGNLVSINRNVSIGHHVEIGKFSTLNPGCNIGGMSKIGECTTIGMGANIFDGVNVGKNTIIGVGSVVTKSIPDNVVAFGVPACVIKENYK
jgi:sugar O-acyltransferase (sialic acid O-acetyltransferase NeuD family)